MEVNAESRVCPVIFLAYVLFHFRDTNVRSTEDRQKEAKPSIECIEMNILFRSLTFLFKIYFFIDLM